MKRIKVRSKSSVHKKITHLYLQDRNLSNIPVIINPSYVQCLYLYNNNITSLNNLNNLSNITSLYLQNNKIAKIENLMSLKKMKKLYLGKNRIGVLEGLESMKELEQLHIEKQDLSDYSPLCFDPRTIINLADTLRILNISHNRINSLRMLSPLKMLINLDASFNALEDTKDVMDTLKNWRFLNAAKFIGNPLAKLHGYRENIIASCFNLECLDDKNISEMNRIFIKRMKEKNLRNTKRSVNLANIVKDLPTNYPVSLQKAASASILAEIQHLNVNNDETYIPWNLFPKRKQFTKTNSSAGFLNGHKMVNEKNIFINRMDEFHNGNLL